MSTSNSIERTIIIPNYIIPNTKKVSTIIKINSPKSEYSNKQNLIDPSKSSPPNDFMNKLEKRIKLYTNIFYDDNIDDNFDIE